MSVDINKNEEKLGTGILENGIMSPSKDHIANGIKKSSEASKGSELPFGMTEHEFNKCQAELNGPRMSNLEKFCYGVGHVYNDMCASMWFSYLLIFYEKVLLFDATAAGAILLVGQLADGFSTPIVGMLSDMENKIPICGRYGRRKIWHLIGTICCTISFPFIFSPAYGLEESSTIIQSIYYACFVSVFQFGWAAVQISHLALIPDLTPKKSQRTELNSIRYAFTVLSNLSVFAMTFVILEAESDDVPSGGDDAMNGTTLFPNEFSSTKEPNGCGTSNSSLQPSDLIQFRTIALACVGVGLIFSIIFHLGVKEPPYCCPKRKDRDVIRMKKMDWFKQYPFYLVAVLYMATRLYVNLYQVYIPLFVQDTLCLAKSAVASVPFTMYLAGFVCSIGMKHLNKVTGRKGTFAIGCFVGMAGCTWAYIDGYSDHYGFVTWGIFVVAVLLGSAGSTLLITSLSITADLIANNTEGGAFVYGIMSFVDKLSNGIIIMIIQACITEDPSYYTDILFYACGGACVLGLLITIALIPVKVGKRRGIAASVCSLMDSAGDNNSDTSFSSASSADERCVRAATAGAYGKNNPGVDVLDTICESLSRRKSSTKSDLVRKRQDESFDSTGGGVHGNVNFGSDVHDVS
uniref:Major facilitator superfamily domain-containing protein 12-like n=1 Tax=Hirondellea gigas TaxID=1518452 RepID=A0A2P2ICJ4_9CRUS